MRLVENSLHPQLPGAGEVRDRFAARSVRRGGVWNAIFYSLPMVYCAPRKMTLLVMTDSPANNTAASPTGSDPQRWAQALVGPLSRRYVVALALVAALVLLDQAILQPLLVQLNFSAPAVNLAGRQRMLSQKIIKAALALEMTAGDEDRQSRRAELSGALERWEAAHRALLHGDEGSNIQPVDRPIAESIRQIEPAFSAIGSAAKEILAEPAPRGALSMSPAAARILELEPVYLGGMERAVAQLEAAARTRVALLRACGLVAMLAILALLVAVYFVVLRPAVTLIGTQVEQVAASDARHRQLAAMLSEARDTLELRVSERTAELREANAALQREMNQRQTAELRMRALSAELAHASRVTALGQLATGLAHEINQPLATVANEAGTLELVLGETLPAESEPRQLVARIQQAALRAGSIVRRMRNFVRRGEVQTQRVDLNLLVGEVCELCRPELREAEVRLSLELATEPVLVSADPVQVQQVLVNLVRNAVQAMAAAPTGTRALRIATRIDVSEVALSISDSGPGLPVEIVDGNFQPFVTSKLEGLGLGLAISRFILEQHQGRLWSRNREPAGAVVGFNLPRLAQHDTSTKHRAHCVCG